MSNDPLQDLGNLAKIFPKESNEEGRDRDGTCIVMLCSLSGATVVRVKLGSGLVLTAKMNLP